MWLERQNVVLEISDATTIKRASVDQSSVTESEIVLMAVTKLTVVSAILYWFVYIVTLLLRVKITVVING